MSVQNFVPIYVVDVEIFFKISENYGQLVVLEVMSGDRQSHKDLSFVDHECWEWWPRQHYHLQSHAARIAKNG